MTDYAPFFGRDWRPAVMKTDHVELMRSTGEWIGVLQKMGTGGKLQI